MNKEGFQPDNINANIHGMVDSEGDITCKTRGGKQCTACCEALEIHDPLLNKEMGIPCSERRINKGCGLLLDGDVTERPRICITYHCSKDLQKLNRPNVSVEDKRDARKRLAMENGACLDKHEIDEKTFNENLRRIPTS